MRIDLGQTRHCRHRLQRPSSPPRHTPDTPPPSTRCDKAMSLSSTKAPSRTHTHVTCSAASSVESNQLRPAPAAVAVGEASTHRPSSKYPKGTDEQIQSNPLPSICRDLISICRDLISICKETISIWRSHPNQYLIANQYLIEIPSRVGAPISAPAATHPSSTPLIPLTHSSRTSPEPPANPPQARSHLLRRLCRRRRALTRLLRLTSPHITSQTVGLAWAGVGWRGLAWAGLPAPPPSTAQ